MVLPISEITDLDDENHLTKSKTISIKVCVNGLLMSKSGIGDEPSTPLSIHEYVADDEDILRAYRI
jgi:hypothetical protein